LYPAATIKATLVKNLAVVSYLESVFDGVGKVLERTDRDGLLRRILRRGVGLREMWNDYLNVALRAERTGLEQRLVVVDTPPVHVHAYVQRTSTPLFTNNGEIFVRFSRIFIIMSKFSSVNCYCWKDDEPV